MVQVPLMSPFAAASVASAAASTAAVRKNGVGCHVAGDAASVTVTTPEPAEPAGGLALLSYGLLFGGAQGPATIGPGTSVAAVVADVGFLSQTEAAPGPCPWLRLPFDWRPHSQRSMSS